MQEGLEASAKYKDKIKEVRGLPQSVEAKERAKLLRMEFMLDNAECARLLIQFIEDHPTATAENFEDYAFATGLISQPEVVQNFIDQLRIEHNTVDRAKKEIEHNSKQNNVGKARVVFSWMGPIKGELFPKPEGKVELDSSYPLALILYTENTNDYSTIDSRTNVGGFYKNVQLYQRPDLSSTEMIYDNFPVIVVKGPNPKNSMSPSRTTEHEKGHVENRAIQEALKVAKKKAVWAESRPFTNNDIDHSVKLLIEKTPAELGKLKESKAWKILLDAALSLAKDELLAEFKAMRGHTEYHQSYMKKRQGLYDYFANRFGIEPKTHLYYELWNDYEDILNQAQIVIMTLVDGYHANNFMLRDRIELMKWVLAQIPIQNWPEQIKGTLFVQETDELHEVNKTIINKIFAAENWRNIEDPKVALAHHFLQEIQQSQNKPLIPIIRKFKQEVAGLEAKSA